MVLVVLRFDQLFDIYLYISWQQRCYGRQSASHQEIYIHFKNLSFSQFFLKNLQNFLGDLNLMILRFFHRLDKQENPAWLKVRSRWDADMEKTLLCVCACVLMLIWLFTLSCKQSKVTFKVMWSHHRCLNMQTTYSSTRPRPALGDVVLNNVLTF